MKLKIICLMGLLLFLATGCQQHMDTIVASGGAQGLRLVIPEEGYHSLSSRDIQVSGMVIDDPDQVQLIFEGEAYPFWSETSASSKEFKIYFYVPPAGRYLTDQVFILQNKITSSTFEPEKLDLEKSNQTNIQSSVTANFVFEKQETYLSQAGMEDPWLWKMIDQKVKEQFVLPLTGDHLTGLRLEIVMWSPSDAPANPDHAINVKLNDVDLGNFVWEGAGRKSIRVPLNEQLLKNENQLTVELAPLEGVLVQKNYLDKITLQIHKELNFGNEENTFTGDGTKVFTRNVSEDGVLVEQISSRGKIRTANINSGSSYQFTTIIGAQYDWLPLETILPVINISPIQWETDLNDVETNIDWLVIAPGGLLPELQPLVDKRRSQGVVPLVVDSQQIYDQFYGGSPQPKALSRFFGTIYNKWNTFPRYVLLVGDFSYERKTFVDAVSEIPSYFVESAFAGETASDMPLMDLNGDEFPDFVIGRIPANNKNQLKNWVEKILEYESRDPYSGMDHIVAIADNQEIGFTVSAQQFLDHFSKDFSTTLYQPEQGEINSNETIRTFFNGTTDLIAYFGHGSIDVWGKEKLFAIEDVTKLNNSELVPIIINLSCLTGYYIHPEFKSLAEALLFQKNSGSIAVIAPTSLTFQTYQSIFSTALANELQFEDNKRLGDIMNSSWRAMDPTDSSSLEVMQTFLLLGDPAMVFHP